MNLGDDLKAKSRKALASIGARRRGAPPTRGR